MLKLTLQESWSKLSIARWAVNNMRKRNLYEPLVVRVQALKSASEATGMVLKIDDLIAALKSEEERKLSKGLEEGAEEETGEP